MLSHFSENMVMPICRKSKVGDKPLLSFFSKSKTIFQLMEKRFDIFKLI